MQPPPFHAQIVMPRSNVVDLQAKGYDLAAAARYNDTESHAKFLAMRRTMAGRQPYGGLFASTLRRITGVMIEHCDELLADAGVVQRLQVSLTNLSDTAANQKRIRIRPEMNALTFLLKPLCHMRCLAVLARPCAALLTQAPASLNEGRC